MKKTLITVGIIAVVVIICYSFFKSTYNSMVTKSEAVTSAWSNVESQYQRRMDLIPNLVNSVKGYAEHEASTLTGVTEARANATKITIDPSNMSAAQLSQFNQAQGELSSALSRLLAVSENYPDLKANQNFLDLQTQLEGTENRIATERRRYNEEARGYNTYIKSFPTNLFASMFGFSEKPYFEASEGSESAPVVEF